MLARAKRPLQMLHIPEQWPRVKNELARPNADVIPNWLNFLRPEQRWRGCAPDAARSSLWERTFIVFQPSECSMCASVCVCVVHSFSCTSFQLHAPVANYTRTVQSDAVRARPPRPRSHETATLYGGELKSMTYSAAALYIAACHVWQLICPFVFALKEK